MSDYVKDSVAEYEAIVNAGMLSLALGANENLEKEVRQDKRRLLASELDSWVPGHEGGGAIPPAGLNRHPLPSGDAARRAVARRRRGQGVSTTSRLPYNFWLEVDKTHEKVAALATQGDPLA